jgi:small-conductance mechanosensitive channel
VRWNLNFDILAKDLSRVFSKPLFTLSGTEVTLLSIFIFLLIICFSIALSFLLQRALKKGLAHRFEKQKGTLAAFLRLVHYTIIIIGLSVCRPSASI